MSSSKKRKTKHRRRGALRLALTVLALTLGTLILLCAVVLIAPLTERVDGSPAAGAESWMARLEDASPLNELILPGTHNSAAQDTPRAFFTKCQALGIGEQLRAGYRYLDLRLVQTDAGDAFLLSCGGGLCKTGGGKALTLDEVLAQCYAFLDAQPTETVLLACSLEENADVRGAQLLLDAYIRESPKYWLLTDTLPTLGEARGRLVLLRGWEDEVGLRQAAGISFRWRDQGGYEDLSLNAEMEEQNGYTLWVQDRYAYGAEAKWDAFLSGVRGTAEGAISLSFLSTRGESAYGHPYEFAKELNARLMEAEDARLGGWIVVDFGSAPLAERIYRLND